MIRFLSVAERWATVEPPRIVTCGAAVATVIFPDTTKDQMVEYAGLYMQNVGANRAYYSFGVEGVGSTRAIPIGVCDNVNVYHGFLEAGQMLDVGHRKIVTVYSPAGTTISTTAIRRNS